MFTKTLVAAAVTLVTLCASQSAFAQFDMSGAIRMQMQNQMIGNQMANRAALQYYQYMQQLRARGYTGPSLPTGITSQSLHDSVRGANDAGRDYIRSQRENSARRSFAVQDHTLRAVRGCSSARSRTAAVYVC